MTAGSFLCLAITACGGGGGGNENTSTAQLNADVVASDKTAPPARTPEVNPGDMARLLKEAELHGAVRVSVGFYGGKSLASLKGISTDPNMPFQKSADLLMAELGAGALSTGRSNIGIGSIGFYATPAGLRTLANSPYAQSFGPDLSGKIRSRVPTFDGSVDAIQAALDANGFADVEIALNVEDSEYDIGKDGRTTFRPSSAAAAEIASRLARLMTEPFFKSVQNLDTRDALTAAAAPLVNARIDLEAFYALVDDDNVRAIRPVGFVDQRAFFSNLEEVPSAERNGTIEVSISLRGGSTFSAGGMTQKALNLQGQANRRAFKEVLAAAGDAGTVDLTGRSLESGSISVRLPYAVLAQLAANADPRLLAININKPMAYATSPVAYQLVRPVGL